MSRFDEEYEATYRLAWKAMMAGYQGEAANSIRKSYRLGEKYNLAAVDELRRHASPTRSPHMPFVIG